MLNVVLCWHMHQPDYRQGGEYLKPWTWLHAIKDYSDMVAHLEAVPQARAVVNFSPVLILQLQDYAKRIRLSLEQNQVIGDPILDALAGRLPAMDSQASLLASLLRVNEHRMKNRFQPYALLHEKAGRALADDTGLPGNELDDLLVWYVLVWLGECLRDLALVRELQAKAGDFSAADRKALLFLLGEVIGDLLPRYRRLAEADRIELSVTPYAHPILPLLQDVNSAHQAMPGAVLPDHAYPGGEKRCHWHLDKAVDVFQDTFAMRPAGCWPSEGAISEETLKLLGRHGFKWTASGARVLFNSLGNESGSDKSGQPHLFAWRLAEESAAPVCFFRDDELSDRIGFEYSKWQAEVAVDDFVHHLEQKLAAWPEESEPVLSIIMDGENAWEYFPNNGHAFLSGLYKRLVSHTDIRLCTFSDALKRVEPRPLPSLVAGSWVYGTFSTWIGDPAKNRAWDLLAGAKSALDAALAPVLQEAENTGSQPPQWLDEILHQLAVCEASDWFWWLGDDNRLEDGPAFDRLFRQQLAGLYELIGMLPPAVLDQPINDPGGSAERVLPVTPGAAGAMRPAGEVNTQ